jgi:hypothetical protein
MLICAIDPGSSKSALVVWNGKKLFKAVILENEKFIKWLELNHAKLDFVAVEMLSNQGRSNVGKETFDTCRVVGQIEYLCKVYNLRCQLFYRSQVKLHHLGKVIGNDSDILKALVKKYGEKGTKKNPGLFYGVTSHCWQALAIATMLTEKPGLLEHLENITA